VNRYFAGVELETIIPSFDQAMAFLRKVNNFIYYYGYGNTLPIRAHWYIDNPDPITEEVVVKENETADINLGVYYAGKTICVYWQDRAAEEKSLYYADKALELASVAIYGFPISMETKLFAGLVYLQHIPKMKEDKRQLYLSKVDKIIEEFRTLSVYNKACFEHKLYLLLAEKEKLNKVHALKVVDLYDKAIRSATEYGFIQFEALGSEMLARFWLAEKRPKYAKIHMQEAFYLYKKWGSKLKVHFLRKNFSEIVAEIAKNDEEENEEHSTSLLDNQEDLKELSQIDLLTVIKSVKAAMAEKSLERYLNKMMKIVLQNAGAERGIFILAEPPEGRLLVVTESNVSNVDVVDETIAVPLADCTADYSKSIITYVGRTKETVIISGDHAHQFQNENYFETKKPKSIMCMPIMRHNDFKGILYLENNLVNDAFVESRVKLINILTSQMAMQLENAKFAELLESKKQYKKLATELQIVKKRLEEFIDVLCHELRNPLNGIIGNKEIMTDLIRLLSQSLQQQDLNQAMGHLKELRDSLKSVDVSSNHMLDIVNTVLSLSMLENQSIRLHNIPFAPAEMMNEVYTMFKASLKKKHITFTLKNLLPEKLKNMVVMGDPHRFKEIIINLLSNAIKFTEKDGAISISSSLVEKTEEHTTLHFEVEDNGIGLTEEEQSRLFKAFSQANEKTYEKFGGSGLGLTISQKLVTLMGGRIQVESKKNAGSKFKFDLKFGTVSEKEINEKANEANNATETSPSAPTQPTAPTTNHTLRILVVEDNVVNLKLLCRLLAMRNYTYDTATNGEEAYIAATTKGRYDVIYMDMVMPVMNGIEATCKIREWEKQHHLKPCKIIGVSANARKEYYVQAVEAGMDDFITKPYQPNDVLKHLQ
jgi:signal transduction histidine kinase